MREPYLLMKVLYITNIPSPYRVLFFDELSKYCKLTVVYDSPYALDRDETWKNREEKSYENIFLKGVRVASDKSLCFSIVSILNKKYDAIIIGSYSSPTALIAIEYLRFHRIPYILNADGGFVCEKEAWIKRIIKTHFISGASCYLSTGYLTDEYLKFYGACDNNIHRYPFTSILEKDIIEYPPRFDQKVELRKQLNINEEYMIISVGQFIPRKGYDLLINSCRNMPENIGIYIVGGEINEYISSTCCPIPNNIHLIPFKKKEDLWKMYQAADLFVFPTREDIWGLVINEAEANALPIISTDHCIAGVETIKGNGKIVPIDADWCDEISAILFDPQIAKYAAKSLEIAREYTIERMVESHMNTLKQLISLNLT